jgi:O-antigen ligase
VNALSFLFGFSLCVSLAVANAALVLFAAAWLWRLASGRERFRPERTSMDLPIAGFMLAWLVASLAGLDPGHSLARAASQGRFVAFYLFLWAGAGAWLGTAVKGYVWGVGWGLIYGSLQYVLSPWIGPGTIDALDFLGSWNQQYMVLRAGRVHGAVHPLTFAEIILPGFLAAVALFLSAGDARSRWKWLAVSGWAGLVLLLTQSRGPWLGAAAGLALIAVLHRRRAWLLVPAAALGAVLVLHPGLRERAATIREKKDLSSMSRLALWRGGLYIAREEPVTGVGPRQLKRATEEMKKRPDFPPNPYGFESDTHNLYIQHLAERGVFGLAALLWLLGAATLAAWRAWKNCAGRERDLALAVLAYFAAFWVFNVTERAFDDAEVALVFWLLTAGVEKLRRGTAARAARP